MLTFIVGCTASGKGALGRELASRAGGEIISVDSMKVYRRMDVGTAKPSLEVRTKFPHHLIDVVEPWDYFSVAEFVKRAEEAIDDIHRRGRPVFLVGGTPLYIKSLTEGLFEGPGADPVLRADLHRLAEKEGHGALHDRLNRVDPVAAARIHPNDLRRVVRALEVIELTGRPISAMQEQWDRKPPRFPSLFIGLRRDRAELGSRINERIRRMLEAGLVDEVKGLLAEPNPMSTQARQALGYAEMIDHLEGRASLAEAVEMIKINTRRLAKAQRTWFRRFTSTHWIDVTGDADVPRIADDCLARRNGEWLPSPN